MDIKFVVKLIEMIIEGVASYFNEDIEALKKQIVVELVAGDSETGETIEEIEGNLP